VKKIKRLLLWPCVIIYAVGLIILLLGAWLFRFRKKWAVSFNGFVRAMLDYHLPRREGWHRWDKERFQGFLSINDSAAFALKMLKNDLAKMGYLRDLQLS
jgi:hypothetical protein